MNAPIFKRGDWVVYVPGHAHGDVQHEDCERGTVTSVHPSGNPVFVVYREEIHAKATSPEDLVRAEVLFGGEPRSPNAPIPQFRAYLGDGVYAGFDGFQVVLTAENGMRATDVVYLEPSVLESFKRWHASQIAPIFQPAEG